MWDATKTLMIFRTFNDVPTGANLSATIVQRFMQLQDFEEVQDLHINVDGNKG